MLGAVFRKLGIIPGIEGNSLRYFFIHSHSEGSFLVENDCIAILELESRDYGAAVGTAHSILADSLYRGFRVYGIAPGTFLSHIWVTVEMAIYHTILSGGSGNRCDFYIPDPDGEGISRLGVFHINRPGYLMTAPEARS